MVKTETKIHTEVVPSINEKKKKYKGVRMRSWGSWVSEIRAPNQKTRIWLGSYSTAEAAARAYDAALLCLKGSSANLNFPSSSSSQYIPQDTTVMSPKSIQRVAAAAANNFMDKNSTLPNSHSPNSPASESSSSPSDQVDDNVSLLSPPFGAYTSIDQGNESIMSMIEPLYDFDYCLQYSPKYVDQMLTGVLFDIDSTQLLDDDLYEESDIRLWNFC